MNMKHINVVPCIGLLLLFAFIVSVANAGASVTELNVNPSVVVQGETLSISGKATPNEEVSLKSSFVISLPVSEGKYSEEFKGIHFPTGKKTFSVRAENIKDIRVSLGPLLFMTFKYPLGGPQKATNGVASLSISLPFSGIDVVGEKNVRVYGAALDDATSVILTTDMAIKITADKNGDFKLDLDTEGVPLGEFSIAAGGKEKTVQIVSSKPESTPTPRSSHDRDEEPVISPTPTITPTVAPTTPLSSRKSSIGPTSSPDQKQTATPEPTPGRKRTPTALSTPEQKQTATPEPTPDQKQTATPKPSPSPPSRLIPGFGAFFAIAGLITVAYLVLALRRK
jgi:uncharacterized protein (DUF2141 family)